MNLPAFESREADVKPPYYYSLLKFAILLVAVIIGPSKFDFIFAQLSLLILCRWVPCVWEIDPFRS
jgi:hypothetical protein